jgi:hypothetical protein
MAASKQSRDFSYASLFPSSPNAFRRGLESGAGFSWESADVGFTQFADGLKLTSSKERSTDYGRCIETRWRHAALGVSAEIRYEVFDDTGVVEIDGCLTNCGKKKLKNVRGPLVLALDFKIPAASRPHVTWINSGGSVESCFPPTAYTVKEVELGPQSNKTLFGGRYGGRSTETELPVAFVIDPETQDGFFCYIEWPCRWITMINRSGTDLLLMPHVAYTDFTLDPGETVQVPKASLGFFNGDIHDGSNLLRRHIVHHVMQPVADAPLLPVTYNHYYGLSSDWTVETLKREASAYAELGVEYFVVDAEWFAGGFRGGVGNWERLDKRRFPNGFDEIVEHVEGLGMKFGSWLEIEFAMEGSHWVKKHPDWFHQATHRPNLVYGTARHKDRLLRLEDPEIRRQVADFMVGWIKRYRMEWLRWDFNDAPAPFWEANEAEQDAGRLQLGYGFGVMALADELRARCPNLHIEACAGGGYRMDLGTLRRVHSAWINDNSGTLEAIRWFKKGVNYVLPGCYANSAFLWMSHADRRQQTLADFKRNGYPPAVIRSQMAGTLLMSEQSPYFSRRDKAYLREEIEKYKSIRHFLMKDFYPIFKPQTLEDYDGWQFHDPETDEGFLMVFRVESPSSRTKVTLRGLTAGQQYELEDMDSGRTRKLEGGKPLTVMIADVQGTAWYRYGANT